MVLATTLVMIRRGWRILCWRGIKFRILEANAPTDGPWPWLISHWRLEALLWQPRLPQKPHPLSTQPSYHHYWTSVERERRCCDEVDNMRLVDYSSDEDDKEDEIPETAPIPASRLPVLPSDFHDLYSGMSSWFYTWLTNSQTVDRKRSISTWRKDTQSTSCSRTMGNPRLHWMCSPP